MKRLINDLSIVIPCKNDEKDLIDILPYVIKFCNKNVLNFEILIVINGSKKENILELNEYIQNNEIKNVELITIETIGKGAAVKKGLLKANFDHILISDADFSVSIDHLLKFIDENGNFLGDFLVGSRRMKKSNNLITPFSRKVSGFLYTIMVKAILGLKVKDTQCGFKVINIKNFKSCKNFIKTNYSYDVELFFLAIQEKILVTEIPVEYIHNKNSNVKIVSDSISMTKDLLSIIWKYRIKKFN